MTGYIIEKYNKMTNAYTCNRLVEEAKNLRIDLKIIGIHDTFVTEDGIYNLGEKLEILDISPLSLWVFHMMTGKLSSTP